jgi:hypothetical protein
VERCAWTARDDRFLGVSAISSHPRGEEAVVLTFCVAVVTAVGGLSLPTTYFMRQRHTRQLLREGLTPDEVATLLRAERVAVVVRDPGA